MPPSPKTWTQKLQNPKPPQIKHLAKAFADMPEGAAMLIPSLAMLDEYVRGLQPGHFVPIKNLRHDLADANRAEHTCPVATSFLLRIVAEAAWEQHLAGKALSEITPFWRVVEPTSALAGKLACGVAFIREQREREC